MWIGAINSNGAMQLVEVDLETLSSAVVAVLGFVYAWQRGVRSDIQVLRRNMHVDMRELSEPGCAK